jgi:hypothetical protein
MSSERLLVAWQGSVLLAPMKLLLACGWHQHHLPPPPLEHRRHPASPSQLLLLLLLLLLLSPVHCR